VPQRVEHAPLKRHQRHENQIGEGDPTQRDRQLKLGGIGTKPRRDQMDELGHENFDHDRKRRHGKQQNPKAFLGELTRTRAAILLQTARKQRNKRGIERPFRKQ